MKHVPIDPVEFRELDGPDWTKMRVRQCMTCPAPTIGHSASTRQAWELMSRRKIHHLIVLDDGGGLLGIVSCRDLHRVGLDPRMRHRVEGLDREAAGLPVAEVMTGRAMTVRGEAGIFDAIDVMRQNEVDALAIVDNEHVLGILTEADIIRALVDALRIGAVSGQRRDRTWKPSRTLPTRSEG